MYIAAVWAEIDRDIELGWFLAVDVQYPAKKSERDFDFFKHLVREK